MVGTNRASRGHRSESGRYIAWAEVVEIARANPGAWVVRLPDQPYRLVYNVRHRNHPDLRLPDGKLEATCVNVYRSPLGPRRGDVYIRFVPNEGIDNP